MNKFSDGMKLGLYAAAILVPFVGAWFVVIASSVLFYSWRKSPLTYHDAQAVNRHGWIAWIVGVIVWGAIAFVAFDGMPRMVIIR